MLKISRHKLSRFLEVIRDVGEAPYSRIDESLKRYLTGIGELISAEGFTWLAGVKVSAQVDDDPLMGWRPLSVHRLREIGDRDSNSVMAEMMELMGEGQVDPQTRAIVALAGRTRACLRKQLVKDKEWYSSYLYQKFLHPRNIKDRLVGAATVSPYLESYVFFDRDDKAPPFSEDDRLIVEAALQLTSRFHAALMRSYGYGDRIAPLTMRERSVLLMLLGGDAEKVIAHKFGLSPKTLHNHVTSIFRKFGVKSRSELMSLWI